MMYEISQEMRKIAIQMEKKRRESALKSTQNNTSTEEQSSSQRRDGTDMFDHQFGSGWREEGDYREGFKKIWKSW